MGSPITESDFDGDSPGQSLCDKFQEKLLNNGLHAQFFAYMFNDDDGTFAPTFIADLMSFLAPVGQYREFPVALASDVANPENGVVYVEATGQELSRTDYARLFAVLGTTFNEPTDSDATQFRVPDRGGKFHLGRNGSHSAASEGGSAEVELELENIPAHSHAAYVGSSDGSTSQVQEGFQTIETGHGGVDLAYLNAMTGSDNKYIQNTGGDSDSETVAHDNMPPFITGVVYIVAGYKVQGAMV